MNFLADIGQFHFLRPALLWLIIPAALACWALARIVFASGGLQKLIDPDLLPHLLMRGGEKRPWLFSLIFALLMAAIIALAGPTWRKLPTPVYSNQDALVILLDLSPSMMATDLAPNRLTRARLKILDILKQRKDGLTALVAYAGEAHVVTPLTDDTATIANLVPSLSPRIMPVPGSNIEMAVQEGLRLIRDGANGAGRLLVVTDGIAKAAVGTIKSEVNNSDATLSILAVGSGEGSPIPKTTGSGFITDDSGSIIIANFDRRELSRLAQSTGGQFAQITVDDSDIARVLPANAMPKQAELTEREFDQWNEEGPWLVLILLPFALLLFRKGTLACAVPLTLTLMQALAFSTLVLSSDNARAAEDSDTGNLWQTPNQQGRDLLQEGNAQRAAEIFENSQWRGTAQYRAGEYGAAAENFAQSESPQGLYNLGNSLTQQGRFDDAIKAYDEALKQNPELADAQHNREIAQKLKELQQKQQQSQQQQNDQQQNQQQDQDSEQNAQQDQQQQSQGDQSQQQNAQQNPQNQQDSEQNAQSQQDQSESEQNQQNQEEQQAQDEQGQNEGEKQEQQANAQPQESDSPLDPETQQALDQWLRQIPDDPAGLMREKFKYESLQRRRAYRAGEWQPPENGATQRW